VRGAGLLERGWKWIAVVGMVGGAVSREQPHFPYFSGISLEGSELMFPDLVQLICSYCHTR
jgi:hypothetical protein